MWPRKKIKWFETSGQAVTHSVPYLGRNHELGIGLANLVPSLAKVFITPIQGFNVCAYELSANLWHEHVNCHGHEQSAAVTFYVLSVGNSFLMSRRRDPIPEHVHHDTGYFTSRHLSGTR
jgi:hypothetical protein